VPPDRVRRDQQRRSQHERPLPPGPAADPAARTDAGLPESGLLQAEIHAALREALASLAPRCQHLLTLLAADPPVPYAQICSRPQMPVGSIGNLPHRAYQPRVRHLRLN
jgi:DNA-directed RNA polymerase specialized sigma24 family protein